MDEQVECAAATPKERKSTKKKWTLDATDMIDRVADVFRQHCKDPPPLDTAARNTQP